MNNKGKALDIYLMGIGGTGMGAFAGLLKQKGHHVFGSDSSVYSPMKEKLEEWGIEYRTPYQDKNLPKTCDLVIVGNVIKKTNPEALSLLEKQLPFDSFPSALNKLFLRDAIPLVASGTHGKTTCSSLLAHTLFNSGYDPGFLVGGIPLNFGESFRASSKAQAPFVVEGDEYDTAYFDKRPKFIHYDPKFLLVTSLEFDHGDIYPDLDAVVDAFSSVMRIMKSDGVMVVNGSDQNIKRALTLSKSSSKIVTYGQDCDYQASHRLLDEKGLWFTVSYAKTTLGEVFIPLFGEHNLSNALGCYAILHQYGLSHHQIALGFKSFLGVKRRLEEKFNHHGLVVIDDFAHHPSAVRETIKAAKQKYPRHKIMAIFEPRSATSCMKIFEDQFKEAFFGADRVLFAPLGRNLPKGECLDTEKISQALNEHGVYSKAFSNYQDLRLELARETSGYVLLFMSNGDFQGLLQDVSKIIC